jgi:multicomponent Na+:H+ antiporter subunit E
MQLLTVRNARIAAVLAVFWLLLSGHYTTLLLVLGGVSVVLVVWFLRRMDDADGEPVRVWPTLGLFGYMLWLLWSVVKANIDLGLRVWNPKMPIRPVWDRLDTKVETPVEKTLYANSITLTPGTLTTDVHEDHFMIHAVTQEGLDELREGGMEARIRKLGL